MNALELFEQHGLNYANEDDVMEELCELDSDELWTLTEQLIGEDPIGITGDEDTQATILRLTLVDALNKNSELITQNDIDLAQEKAFSLIDEIQKSSDTVSENDTIETEEAEENTETKAAKPIKKRTRKRTSTSRELIKTLVSDNPNAEREVIIAEAMESDDFDVSEATAVMYFYDVRKELKLGTNGQRGRKKTNTKERVQKLLLDNKTVERAELIDLIVSELGYKKNTATVYYHNALKDLKESNQI